MAFVRLRSWNRGGLVWPVPVLAARGRTYGRDRLALHAAGLRRHPTAGAAARVRDLTRERNGQRRCGGPAVLPPSVERSLRPRLLRASPSSFLHLAVPSGVHHHPP